MVTPDCRVPPCFTQGKMTSCRTKTGGSWSPPPSQTGPAFCPLISARRSPRNPPRPPKRIWIIGQKTSTYPPLVLRWLTRMLAWKQLCCSSSLSTSPRRTPKGRVALSTRRETLTRPLRTTRTVSGRRLSPLPLTPAAATGWGAAPAPPWNGAASWAARTCSPWTPTVPRHLTPAARLRRPPFLSPSPARWLGTETCTSVQAPCSSAETRTIDSSTATGPSPSWPTAATLARGPRARTLCPQRCTTTATGATYRRTRAAPGSCTDRPGLPLRRDLGSHRGTGDTSAHRLAEVEAEGYHTEHLFFLRHIIFIWKDFSSCNFRQQIQETWIILIQQQLYFYVEKGLAYNSLKKKTKKPPPLLKFMLF